MMRGLLAVITSLTLAFPTFAQDTKKTEEPKKVEKPKTGRPGELTPEEEDKLDAIVDRFIEYDIGINRDPKALADFQKLGPEAIPALIRGLNKSATISHSCPVAVIAKKLNGLLASTEDEEVLAFAWENIGAGVNRTPYASLLNNLKLNTVYRKRQLYEMKAAAAKRTSPPATTTNPATSPGAKSPGETLNPPKSPGDPAPNPGQRSPGEKPKK